MNNIDNKKLKEDINEDLKLKDVIEQLNVINKTINYILDLIRNRNF
jgi:hypothetical protein